MIDITDDDDDMIDTTDDDDDYDNDNTAVSSTPIPLAPNSPQPRCLPRKSSFPHSPIFHLGKIF